jgi:hypothetical protein
VLGRRAVDLIGELLRSSLLTELGDDEDRVGRVRSAVKDLTAEFLSGSRALVPYAVIAAIDESIPADAAPLALAERALLDSWVTFRNAFPGRPTEILRAVALAAVADVADGDDSLRHAAWYALRTAIECLPAGRWDVPVTGLAAHLDELVRRNIANVWSPATVPNRLRMPTILKVDDKRIPVNTPLRNRAEELEGAANYNVFAQQLQGEFAKHVDQLVGVSEILSAEAYKRSVAQLRDFAAGLGSRLRDALAAQDQAMEAVRLRSELLWWRQTAFSPRISRSYADLDPADVAIVAAVDLHEMVPPIAPVAVEHLLTSLVNTATSTADLAVEALRDAEHSRSLPATDHTPAMLIDAVGNGTETRVVPHGQSVTVSRAAVLIFRDLQARRLTAMEPPERSGEEE